MRFVFEFSPHTALGILQALEVFTAPNKTPSDPDEALDFEQLMILQDAFRTRATEIQMSNSKPNRTDWFLL